MKILVIGGYGLIGRSVCRYLHAEGYDVVGLGRSLTKGKAAAPHIDWKIADLATLLSPSDWSPLLKGIGAVVNCAGLLQDGMGDDVVKVQRDAIIALITACEREGVQRLVQISAPGISEASDTAFYRTKAEADNAIVRSDRMWTILRPGLVLAPHAYGGTSLLRMLAAMPGVLPVMQPDVLVQTVSVANVAEAVRRAVDGELDGLELDLVEAQPHRLVDVVAAFRDWFGWKPVWKTFIIPNWIGRQVGRCADIAGWLGWRSALRSTSLKVLADGVRGDASQRRRETGQDLLSLSKTLAARPATAQDRLHARAMLIFPVVLLALSAFWIASGVIGLVKRDAAVAVLGDSVSLELARAFVFGGAFLDIAIGAAMLVRPWCRPALTASMLLALAYLVGAAVLTPHLWADPLGPFVKVIPAIALAAVIRIIHPER